MEREMTTQQSATVCLDVPDKISAEAARIPSIDGLRALAILLVMVHHYTPWILHGDDRPSLFVREATQWFGSGVDLFFVLSGFLITGILVDSKGSRNYFSRFYWRRSIRIFPAYYAFLVPALYAPGLFTGISRPWFVFYLRNWRGADPASDGILGHLWSLAVEEQFYIGWSVLVFLVAVRWLPHLILALIAVAPLVRAMMGYWGYPGYEIVRVTPARMDSLVLGALVAVSVRSSWQHRLPTLARFSLVIGAGSLTVVRVFAGPLNMDNRIMQVAFPFFMPLLYASVLALCLEIRPGIAATVLTNSFFRIVAKYSYAMYLVHLYFGLLVLVIFRILGQRFPIIDGV